MTEWLKQVVNETITNTEINNLLSMLKTFDDPK